MKNTIILFIGVLLLVSCEKKTQKYFEEISDKYYFNSIKSSSDKILIRLKKINQNESTMNDSCFENVAAYKAENSNQIERFEKLFVDSNYTGYCCCPETNLSIGFYKNSKEIDIYFVDTIQFKDKVRIFENGFQYSFLIDKQKWKNYLKEIKTE
jgi:hypothetical protein